MIIDICFDNKNDHLHFDDLNAATNIQLRIALSNNVVSLLPSDASEDLDAVPEGAIEFRDDSIENISMSGEHDAVTNYRKIAVTLESFNGKM